VDYPSPLVVDPSGSVRHSIVWLHGLGADGRDFLPVAEALRLPPELGVRFLFPQAPRRPVTVNGGLAMPAWYDIYSLEAGAPVDLEGIRRSVAYVQSLVRQEQARGVEPERVVLAGFSQGGLVALAAALHGREALAGVAALSTYLPQAVVPEIAIPRRVFQAHGRQDEVVPLSAGVAARDRLLAQGHQVAWHQYDMGHTVCAEEVVDLRVWLMEALR